MGIMGIKEFIKLTLDEVKDKKWLKKVDSYNEFELGFYEPNWFTSFDPISFTFFIDSS